MFSRNTCIKPKSSMGDLRLPAVILSDSEDEDSQSGPRSRKTSVLRNAALLCRLKSNASFNKSPKEPSTLVSPNGGSSFTQPGRVSGSYFGERFRSNSKTSVLSEPCSRAESEDKERLEWESAVLDISTKPEARDCPWDVTKDSSTYQARDYFRKDHERQYHPYKKEETPYMQAYSKITVASDCATEKLLNQLTTNDSPTFYDYKGSPPLTVLDLGCGSGDWVISTARKWLNSRITGFDLVNNVSMASQKAALQLGNNHVEWVRGNFIKYALPFPDESFELVRMANLGLCIPVANFPTFYKEINRVLAPQGRLELIDDQMLFPYADVPEKESVSAHFDRQHTVPRSPRLMADQSGFFDSDDEAESSDGSSTVYTDDSEHNSELTPTHGGDREKLLRNTPDEVSSVESIRHDKPKSSRRPQKLPAPLSVAPFESAKEMPMPRFGHCPIAWARYISVTRPDKFPHQIVRDPPFKSQRARNEWFENLFRPLHANLPDAVRQSLWSAQNQLPEEGRLTSKSHRDAADWKTQAEVCQAIERIFLHMLRDEFGIHHRPYELLVETLESIFASVTKMPTMHIALAPVDYEKAEEQVTFKWLWSKKDPMGSRSSTETLVTALPETLSSKAAKRLGISADLINMNPLDFIDDGQVSSSNVQSGTLTLPETSPIVIVKNSTHMLLQEERVVMNDSPSFFSVQEDAYCEDCEFRNHSTAFEGQIELESERALEERTTHDSMQYTSMGHPIAVKKNPKKIEAQQPFYPVVEYVAEETPRQSPGIIVWPSRFVAFNPMEVELLACKSMNDLLSCHSAFQRYVTKLKDEDGEEIMTEAEFDEQFCDYESFRRVRLRLNDNGFLPDSHCKPKMNLNRRLSSIVPPDQLYKPEELTFVRAIRVFHATKSM